MERFDLPFAADVVLDGTSMVVHLSGELDSATTAVLLEEVESAAASSVDAVVVDLTSLTFIDVAGLRCLSSLAQAVSERATLRVIGTSGFIRCVIAAIGLDRLVQAIKVGSD